MQDIIIDDNNDIAIANGDLLVAYSDAQHQQLLLLTNKGDWKENPTIAVGVAGFLKSESPSALLGEIKQEFERDGMNVNYVGFQNEKLVVDAGY